MGKILVENKLVEDNEQEIRQYKKEDEAEVVYEDDNWLVLKPNTYEANCILGRDTKWCSSDTRTRNYFDKLNKSKSIYININKNNPNEKYLFNADSRIIKNKDDREISENSFFANNEDLYDFYKKNILENKISEKYTLKEDIDIKVYKYDGTPFPKSVNKELIQYVEIDESVTKIESGAFSNCLRLTVVKMHEGITEIGDHAFSWCFSLEDIDLPQSLKKIDESAFYGCRKLKYVTLPNNLEDIESGAFAGCKELNDLVLPNSLTYIGGYAFYQCKQLKTIKIPESVWYIGKGVFEGCTSLQNIIFPERLENVPTAIVKDCTSLTTITLPDGATHSGTEVFKGCTNLREVHLPNALIAVKARCFEGCTSLTHITLPERLNLVGTDAFKNCPNLTRIICRSMNCRFENRAFYMSNSRCVLYCYPDSSFDISRKNKQYFKNITVAELRDTAPRKVDYDTIKARSKVSDLSYALETNTYNDYREKIKK